jgi:pimeloyl-ACP methyl ester carboxylesterase
MEQRCAQVEGRSVRWRAAGAGPPVVLVHGLSGSWRWWTQIADELAQRREVHLLDVGAAPARASDWLAAWADAAGIGAAAYVGHSLGGAVCARLAAARPERVERLVLVSPVGMPSGRRLLGYAAPLAEALLVTAPSFLRTLALDAARTGPPRLLAGALYATRADISDEARTIMAPTLLLWGARDPLVPASLAAAWREAVPQARLVTIAGAGHVPMVERPRELASAVLAFLDEARDGMGGAPVGSVRGRHDDEAAAG